MSSSRSISILYGTQTGTAESIAHSSAIRTFNSFVTKLMQCPFCRDACEFSNGTLTLSIFPLDSFPFHLLSNSSLVMFICSTTGNGDPPSTMRRFWRSIMRASLPIARGSSPGLLSGLRCGVLGLGDSSYTNYNVVAKMLYRRLIQLGADVLTPLGLADDQCETGIESAAELWLATFWKTAFSISLCQTCSSSLSAENAPSSIISLSNSFTRFRIDPPFQIVPFTCTRPNAEFSSESSTSLNSALFVDPECRQSALGAQSSTTSISSLPQAQYWQPLVFECMSNEQLTVPAPAIARDTRLLRFRARHPVDAAGLEAHAESALPFVFALGDVLCVQPSNSSAAVEEFLSFFKLDGDQCVEIELSAAHEPSASSTATLAAASAVSASASAATTPTASLPPVRAESHSRRALLEQLERLTRLHRGVVFGELCCGEREVAQRCSRCRDEHDVVLAPPTTVRVLVRDVLDFGRRASRALIEQLLCVAHWALTRNTFDPAMPSESSDMDFERLQKERDRLEELCSPQGLDDLFSYCYRDRRTIFEVLVDFPTTSSLLTLCELLEIIPYIKSRQFSIASSPMMALPSGELELLVGVVDYRTKLVRPRVGVCTQLLSALQSGAHAPSSIPSPSTVLAWLEPGLLSRALLATLCPSHQLRREPGLDAEACALAGCRCPPCILIGTGTGYALLRALIAHRLALHIASKIILFFGVRSSSRDNYFQRDLEVFPDWRRAADDGVLTAIPAFSRDQVDKVYVQHRIEEHSELVSDLLLKDGAFICVCGTSKFMPAAVEEAFAKSLAGRIEPKTDPSAFIRRMQSSGRYLVEVW